MRERLTLAFCLTGIAMFAATAGGKLRGFLGDFLNWPSAMVEETSGSSLFEKQDSSDLSNWPSTMGEDTSGSSLFEKQDSNDPPGQRQMTAFKRRTAMGCIETKNCRPNIGNSFVIGRCHERNYQCGVDISLLVDFSNVRNDEPIIGQLTLRMDPTRCMQATHGGVLTHGAWMRVYPCNDTSPLQRFRLFAGGIRLEDTDWCISHLGSILDHFDDHIMLKSCHEMGYG